MWDVPLSTEGSSTSRIFSNPWFLLRRVSYSSIFKVIFYSIESFDNIDYILGFSESIMSRFKFFIYVFAKSY